MVFPIAHRHPSSETSPDELDTAVTPQVEPSPAAPHSTKSILWKLYLSHILSTWNARTFEFGAVVFLATVFPGTLFYASCYALFRSLTAFLLSSAVGSQVDSKERLAVVRLSIVWQRVSVAASCGLLLLLLRWRTKTDGWMTIVLFAACVVLAGVEKLAFVGNTVAVERDWVVVVAEDLGLPREDLNSKMRRIDLVCKLVAPLGVSLVEMYSTEVTIMVILGQNLLSAAFVGFSYGSLDGVANVSRNTLPLRKYTMPSQVSQPGREDVPPHRAISKHLQLTLVLFLPLSVPLCSPGKPTS